MILRPIRRRKLAGPTAALALATGLAACATTAPPAPVDRTGGLPADPAVLAANGYGAPGRLINRADRNNDRFLDATELRRLRALQAEGILRN